MGLRTVRLLLWLPLAAFFAVLLLAWTGLIGDHDTSVRSRMVGRPMPAVTLPLLDGGGARSTAALAGAQGPVLVNLFASWCVPCAAEAPQLMALRRAGVRVVGIAVRDRPEDTRAFLARFGDPYAAVLRDDHATAQLALGSSGVPETFLVGRDGTIRFQQIGDIRPEQVDAVRVAVAGAAR